MGKRRRVYTPARTAQFERQIGELWQQQVSDPPLEGPLGMRLAINTDYLDVQLWELDRSYRPKYITGDADNYLKSLSDGLNGIAFNDDRQLQHIEIFFTKEEYNG